MIKHRKIKIKYKLKYIAIKTIEVKDLLYFQSFLTVPKKKNWKKKTNPIKKKRLKSFCRWMIEGVKDIMV